MRRGLSSQKEAAQSERRNTKPGGNAFGLLGHDGRRPIGESLEPRLLLAAEAADFGWAFGVGASGSANIYATTSDSGGNIYLAGSYTGSVDVDFGPGVTYLSSPGGEQVLVGKYDSAGQLIWARSMGGYSPGSTSVQMAKGIAVDAGGNVYTTGSFFGTADFDPGDSVYTLRSCARTTPHFDSGF